MTHSEGLPIQSRRWRRLKRGLTQGLADTPFRSYLRGVEVKATKSHENENIQITHCSVGKVKSTNYKTLTLSEDWNLVRNMACAGAVGIFVADVDKSL